MLSPRLPLFKVLYSDKARKKHFIAHEKALWKRDLLKSQASIIQYGTVGHKRDICNFVPVGPFSVAGHFIYASIRGV